VADPPPVLAVHRGPRRAAARDGRAARAHPSRVRRGRRLDVPVARGGADERARAAPARARRRRRRPARVLRTRAAAAGPVRVAGGLAQRLDGPLRDRAVARSGPRRPGARSAA
jgi:hypothetical protein